MNSVRASFMILLFALNPSNASRAAEKEEAVRYWIVSYESMIVAERQGDGPCATLLELEYPLRHWRKPQLLDSVLVLESSTPVLYATFLDGGGQTEVARFSLDLKSFSFLEPKIITPERETWGEIDWDDGSDFLRDAAGRVCVRVVPQNVEDLSGERVIVWEPREEEWKIESLDDVTWRCSTVIYHPERLTSSDASRLGIAIVSGHEYYMELICRSVEWDILRLRDAADLTRVGNGVRCRGAQDIRWPPRGKDWGDGGTWLIDDTVYYINSYRSSSKDDNVILYDIPSGTAVRRDIASGTLVVGDDSDGLLLHQRHSDIVRRMHRDGSITSLMFDRTFFNPRVHKLPSLRTEGE